MKKSSTTSNHSINTESDEDNEDLQETTTRNTKKKNKYIMSSSSRDNHCEIERKRREKMVNFLSTLKEKTPTCQALERTKTKTNKLEILQMILNYLKSIKIEGPPGKMSSFLTCDEVKHLILLAATGFLFIVKCDCGQIVYVSESVSSVLNCDQNEWINSSFYDKIHEEDKEKVQQQLSLEKYGKPTWLQEMQKTKEKTSECHKRNFICKMKVGNTDNIAIKNEANYILIRCSGFIKQYPPDKMNYFPCDYFPKTENCSKQPHYLIAIGRLQQNSFNTETSINLKVPEFITRHKLDGTCTFVDARITDSLGYLPKHFLGKKYHEFFHSEDKCLIIDAFKQVLSLKNQVLNINGRIKSINEEWISLKLSIYTLNNPYTDEVQFIMCNNSEIDKVCKNQLVSSEDCHNLEETKLEPILDTKNKDSAIKMILTNHQSGSEYYYPNKNDTKKYLTIDCNSQLANRHNFQSSNVVGTSFGNIATKPDIFYTNLGGFNDDNNQLSQPYTAEWSQLGINENWNTVELRENTNAASYVTSSLGKDIQPQQKIGITGTTGFSYSNATLKEYSNNINEQGASCINAYVSPSDSYSTQEICYKDESVHATDNSGIDFDTQSLNTLEELLDLINDDFQL